MHRRTAMITAGSIAVVALTGAIAVGANIGILASAGASDLGALTAVAEVETIESGPVLAAPSVESPAAPLMTSQEFEADEAGVVEVLFSADELRLGSVHPASGWTWSSDQADGKGLFVKFQSDDGKELEYSQLCVRSPRHQVARCASPRCVRMEFEQLSRFQGPSPNDCRQPTRLAVPLLASVK